MLKIILVDDRVSFVENVSTRALLNDSEIEIIAGLSGDDLGNLNQAINAHQPDLLVICENVLDMQKDWDYADIGVVGYAISSEGARAFDEQGIPCYGIVKNSTHLLNLLNGPIPARKNAETQPGQKKEPQLSKQKKQAKQSAYQNPDEEEEIDQSEPPLRRRAQTERLQNDAEKPEYNSGKRRDPIREEKQRGDKTEKRNFDDFHGSRFENRSYEDEPEAAERDRISREPEFSKNRTVVATVYSSKGGVGKTTISAELAAYLSLTSRGRRRNQVCIIDYNIDFGNIRETLGYKNNGADMTFWAMDIQERLDSGERARNITYNKREIQTFLQVMDRTGLYALCAPLAHTSSMDITKEILEIMLDNIIYNGGYDYVICDTGNNTRDSSYLALEAADYVFLVVTQDVSTVSSNTSVIEALEKMHFDMNKIWLVLNNEVSAKHTDGVSASDVEEHFEKHLDHPCIAHIKHDLDVLQANNAKKPIVCCDSSHDFTKEIGKIVKVMTGREEELNIPKSLFRRLFKKK